ncbi:hypothetical protein C345_04822 [Cryptococcus neoformans A2-102-5]|nr:hypothetical protein C346_04931 [Cryptococcus neoformans var. grubii D17-1]OXG93640.1 hypothetical protein C345_04822 [Cryptococcus neoformans var. grubii A2-102-5]
MHAPSPFPTYLSDVAIWGSSNDHAPSTDSTELARTNSFVRRRHTPGSMSSLGAAAGRSTPSLLSDNVTVPGPSRRRPSRTLSSTPSNEHPLSYTSSPPYHPQRLADTRPALQRATSATERQVAESSKSGSEWGSTRGSLDVLRMSSVDESSGEVEVLIHTVKPHESLAGIALLYGIDLATLRKVNKLWASDPIHIRTHLYVPLDACRWNKASEALVRGPGEGQVTLMPKNARGKGKGKETDELLTAGDDEQRDGLWFSQSINGDSPHSFLSSTNIAYDRPTPPTIPPPIPHPNDSTLNPPISPNPEPIPRVLDVVRIPSSQLRFFPRARPSEPSSRASTEQDRPPPSGENTHPDDSDDNGDDLSNALRRASFTLNADRSDGNGPSIVPNLSTLPEPLRPPSSNFSLPPAKPSRTRSSKPTTVVRLRPPQPAPIQTGNNNSLANRLSSFFTVPPPPANMSPISGPSSAGAGAGAGSGRLPQGKPRRSLESIGSHRIATPKSATSVTRRGSGIDPSTSTSKGGREQREEMELVTRVREGVGSGMGMGSLGERVGNGFGARKSAVKGKKSQKND